MVELASREVDKPKIMLCSGILMELQVTTPGMIDSNNKHCAKY